jgi:hypothetical protein
LLEGFYRKLGWAKNETFQLMDGMGFLQEENQK